SLKGTRSHPEFTRCVDNSSSCGACCRPPAGQPRVPPQLAAGGDCAPRSSGLDVAPPALREPIAVTLTVTAWTTRCLGLVVAVILLVTMLPGASAATRHPRTDASVASIRWAWPV